jgi:apolipoprotein N-acyltransferase
MLLVGQARSVNVLDWTLIVAATAFTAVGRPADALARRPGARGGLGWFGLTFGAPAVVWILIAMVGGPDDDLADVAYFLGYSTSVAAVFVGTMLSRMTRRRRRLSRRTRSTARPLG